MSRGGKGIVLEQECFAASRLFPNNYGSQWRSCSVLDLKPKGPRFDPVSRAGDAKSGARTTVSEKDHSFHQKGTKSSVHLFIFIFPNKAKNILDSKGVKRGEGWRMLWMGQRRFLTAADVATKLLSPKNSPQNYKKRNVE